MSKHLGHAFPGDDDDTQPPGATSPFLGREHSADGIGWENYTLYLKEPGSAAAVSMGDIHQGSLTGDCFMLAALDEITRQSVIQGNASFMPSMIHANVDGTETVKLYAPAANGHWGAVNQVVTNYFTPGTVNTGPFYGVVGSQKEIWPQVIEKAFAQQAGGFPAISNGGWPAAAMQTLTGQQAASINPYGLTPRGLTDLTNNNDLLVFDTVTSDLLPYNLVGNHAYAFAGFADAQHTKVNLQNPWGFDNPAPVPITAMNDGTSGIFQLDIGHFKLGAGYGINLA